MTYNVNDNFGFKANIARGYRAPNASEISAKGVHPGTGFEQLGDANFKPEFSLQEDAGIFFSSKHVSGSADVFNNVISNYIYNEKLASLNGGDSLFVKDGNSFPVFKFRQTTAQLYGGELSLDIHPHPLDWLHFENTFSYVSGKFSEAIEGVDNVPFIPAPRLLSQLGGTFYKQGKKIRNLSVKIEMDANFKQNKPFTAFNTETATPAYTLFNASIGTEIRQHNKTLFSIYFNAVNFTDVAYQSHLSRLKYAPENPVTGRMGVYNMGRNFSIKLNVPISGKLKTDD